LSADSNAPAESFFNNLMSERVHGTRYGTHREAVSDFLNTSKCFITAVVVIHRVAFCRQLSSCRTGLRLRGQRIRLHDPGPLEGEKNEGISAHQLKNTMSSQGAASATPTLNNPESA
jgi:hypothetical protein